jgi:hypothetical protein
MTYYFSIKSHEVIDITSFLDSNNISYKMMPFIFTDDNLLCSLIIEADNEFITLLKLKFSLTTKGHTHE